jgi:hypothetical protein
MKSFFIRHTDELAIPEKDIKALYGKHKIFIHFPDLPANTFKTSTAADINSINPLDYKTSDRNGMKRFNVIAENGGYVWAQYYTSNIILVGIVKPKTSIVKCESVWVKPPHRVGMKAIVKTLQLESVIQILPDKALSLKVTRPRQGTLSEWPSVKDRLACLIEGKDIPMEWDSLGSSQQEIACVEYLRKHSSNEIPRLKYLLLPPGRTMKSIDIYGIAEDGKKIFVQVTHITKDEAKANKKTDCFDDFPKGSNYCLFFCNCEKIENEDGIIFVPYQLIETWLDQDRPYFKSLIE